MVNEDVQSWLMRMSNHVNEDVQMRMFNRG